MSSALNVSVNLDLVREALLRMLAELEPDAVTPLGKRDMRLKSEVDALLGYLQAAKPDVHQSNYPVPGPIR